MSFEGHLKVAKDMVHKTLCCVKVGLELTSTETKLFIAYR